LVFLCLPCFPKNGNILHIPAPVSLSPFDIISLHQALFSVTNYLKCNLL
jgi:hypothetical protein